MRFGGVYTVICKRDISSHLSTAEPGPRTLPPLGVEGVRRRVGSFCNGIRHWSNGRVLTSSPLSAVWRIHLHLISLNSIDVFRVGCGHCSFVKGDARTHVIAADGAIICSMLCYNADRAMHFNCTPHLCAREQDRFAGPTASKSILPPASLWMPYYRYLLPHNQKLVM
jgi:hypothetical protein